VAVAAHVQIRNTTGKQAKTKNFFRLIGLWQNDERRHLYKRWPALITGLRLEIRKIIETGGLVEVALARLLLPLGFSRGGQHVAAITISAP
jgi:hypothetical protein